MLIENLRRAYRRESEKLTEPDDEGSPRRASATAMVSSTDPDASVARKGGGDAARPRYKNHRAVDDQCGVITATKTTSAAVSENHKLMSLVEQHEANTGEKVKTVVADSQYGTNENFASCQQHKIRSHMKDLRATYSNDAAKRGIFRETDFRFDEQTQTYICPAGERLKRSITRDRQFEIYRSTASICRQCRLRSQCFKSKHSVRTLKRHVAHAAIERARAESHSGWARKDRRRRKHLMEGSFADAANQHGFKRSRWRRLHNQKIQDLLIAACQNIRIFVRYERRRNAATMVIGLPQPSGRSSALGFGRVELIPVNRRNLRQTAAITGSAR